MPTIITDPGVEVTDFLVATVELKDALSDVAWQQTQHVYCDRISLAANAYDEAELAYELGDVVQPGEASFNQYDPLDWVGKFVRVTVPQTAPLLDIIWVGYIVGTAKQRSAVKGDNPATNKLTGKKQILRAVGLEYFLDRRQIDSSVIYDTTNIYRPITFNGGQGTALDADTRDRGNRSASSNTDGVYAFVQGTGTGNLWTIEQTINYLLQYYSTKDAAGADAPLNYSLHPQDVLAGTVDGIAPTLKPENMTTFQALNKLLAPQRGFIWWLEYDEPFPGSYSAYIRVETLTSSAIALPSTGTWPANRDQQSLDFDGQRDVGDVVTSEIGSRRYHQIICRGARMTSTATFGATEWNIDWLSTIATEYDAETDAARKAERFYRLYSAFRIDTAWDGKTGDGGAGARDWTFPEIVPVTQSIVGSLPWAIEGLRIMNHTRLKRGWDYSDTGSIEETTPTGTEAEYMPLFAVVEVDSTNDKFQFVDKMSKVEFTGVELVSENIHTSYNVATQQTAPGWLLRSHSLPHTMALNHFSPSEPSDVEAEVDYDTLRFTCTIEADAFAEAKWPGDGALPAGVPLEKLLLYFGDDYRLDFLAPNTVIDLDDGDPVLTNGGILRDDRATLVDVARVAYEWYSLDRRPITVQFKQVSNYFRIGMFVTAIGSGTTQENVNSVVSIIDYNLLAGTTTIKTNDADLDFVRLV